MKNMTSFDFLLSNDHFTVARDRRIGSQRKFRFPNGFGASVVKWTTPPFGGSYGAEDGLYELAVLAWESEDESAITYRTTITNDVLGYLTADQVEETLDEIRALECLQ